MHWIAAAWRPVLVLAAAGVVVAGVAVAASGGNATPAANDPLAAAVPTGSPAPVETSSPVATTTASTAPVPEPTAVVRSEDSSSPGTLVAVAPTARPATVLPATSTPARVVPVADIPKYTDLAVLALAADAVLPSGKTFRECVELPPSHEKWPTPVHLYYEGNGRWLVETHVSEVQVVFDEATATFRPRNFAPANPACR
jgi:hypothetical protein